MPNAPPLCYLRRVDSFWHHIRLLGVGCHVCGGGGCWVGCVVLVRSLSLGGVVAWCGGVCRLAWLFAGFDSGG